jgi:hypothetical protein
MVARAAIYRLITTDRAVTDRAETAADYLADHIAAYQRILAALRAM